MGTRMLIVSFDALINEDLPCLKRHPVFAAFLKDAAMVKTVRSIYPTLTYPCHTTMLTGCYPDRHGVTANEPFLPGTDPLPWNFYHDAVRVRDLHDACKEAGLTTASVGWPVTGNHPSVDYLVDEIWPMEKMSPDSLKKTLLSSGTKEEVFEEAVKPYVHLRLPKKQPETVFFSTSVSCEIIRKYRPDFMTIHLSNLDTYRHKAGVFSPLIEKGVEELARCFEMLEDALKANGDDETCNMIITSDHGQMDCARGVFPNVLLKEKGYITVDSEGKVTDWRAFCLETGMSAQIYLRDPSDPVLCGEIRDLFEQRIKEGLWGYSAIRSAEELRKTEHLSGEFSFVLETDNYTHFENAWNGPYIRQDPLQLTSNRYGSHGYHPDKGPAIPFLAKGPAFRPGAVLEKAFLVDQAPTCARALGVSLPDTDGSVMESLLA